MKGTLFEIRLISSGEYRKIFNRADNLNDAAKSVSEKIPAETDEQKAALEMATVALKGYKCIELAPLDNKAFYAFKQDQVLHIYCKDQEEMNKVIEIIKKGWGEKCQKI